MSDFYQSGVITTFHRLGKYNLEAIEATLAEYTERRPIALVLPCLYSELDGPAIARELMVSLNTMRTHTKNIYAKLAVTSRRAAVRRAAELGLLRTGNRQP